jgi:putative endonuclease
MEGRKDQGPSRLQARPLLGFGSMSQARQVLGKYGEDLACLELERRGYAIVARRYRRRGGEIDIIARDGETTVFVEVKARDGHEFGDAAEAITRLKQRRMAQIALDYLMRHHLDNRPARFDVVSIHLEAGRPVVDLFQNAFDA